MKLISPEDFASAELTVLRSVLETLTVDGWTYEVEAYGRQAISILLTDYSGNGDAGPFRDFGRLVGALARGANQHDLKAFVTVHGMGNGQKLKFTFAMDYT